MLLDFHMLTTNTQICKVSVTKIENHFQEEEEEEETSRWPGFEKMRAMVGENQQRVTEEPVEV